MEGPGSPCSSNFMLCSIVQLLMARQPPLMNHNASFHFSRKLGPAQPIGISAKVAEGAFRHRTPCSDLARMTARRDGRR